MKISSVIRLLGLALAFIAFSARADWSVSSVTELTNALEQINSGASSDTVVTLAAKTYDLSDICMHSNANMGASCLYIGKTLTVQGADDTSWRTTADGDTKTVLDAGANAKRRVIGIPKDVSKPILRNLTIIRGNACTPERANNNNNTAGGAILHEIGVSEANYARLYNCVLRHNTATYRGAAARGVEFHDCRIVYNHRATADLEWGALVYGGNFYDCFVGFSTNKGTAVTCTIASNTVFNAIGTSNWGSDTFALTKAYDCIFTNRCRGSFKLIDVNAANKILSGCTFVDLPYPCANTYPIVRQTDGLITNCTFRHCSANQSGCCITTQSSKARIIDCVFTNNYNDTGWNSGRGLCIAGMSSTNITVLATSEEWPTVRDCDFLYNWTTNRAGAYGGACACVNASNCTFIGNSTWDGAGAVYGGRYVDCYFKTNCTTRNASGEWHCGGAAGNGGEYYTCTFEDCVDINNCGIGVRKGRGAVTCADVVSNCTFRNCWASSYGSAVTRCPRVIDCTFENCRGGNGMTCVSGLLNCTFTGNGRYALYQGAATNCLFYALTNDSTDRKYVFCDVNSAVNCTIADITDANYRLYSTAKNFTFVCENSIIRNIGGLWGVANGTRATFDHCLYDEDKTETDGNKQALFTNCVQTAANPFVNPSRAEYDPKCPYAIRHSVKTWERGTNGVGFTAADTDRAGRPRLRGGAGLDLGCYQCQLPVWGLMTTVK